MFKNKAEYWLLIIYLIIYYKLVKISYLYSFPFSPSSEFIFCISHSSPIKIYSLRCSPSASLHLNYTNIVSQGHRYS